jgi:hypothetical protein
MGVCKKLQNGDDFEIITGIAFDDRNVSLWK